MVSLFTNVPASDTIKIPVDTFQNQNLPPDLLVLIEQCL